MFQNWNHKQRTIKKTQVGFKRDEQQINKLMMSDSEVAT